MKKTTTIKHPSELNKLKKFPLFKMKGLGRIKLSQDLNHELREQFEMDINKFYYACGCDTGAKFLIYVVLLVFAYKVVLYTQLIQVPGYNYWILLLTILAASFLGKIIGLYKANKKLKNTIKELQEIWKVPTEVNNLSEPLCG